MHDTNYVWDDKTDESRFAIGYDKTGKPYKTVKK
jgi:hypothetical protein